MRIGPVQRAVRRQRRHHPAFRIEPPAWNAAERTRLRELAERVTTTLEQVRTAAVPDETDEPPQSTLDETALVEAATNLWRADRRNARSDASDRRSSDTRNIGRFLRLSQDKLNTAAGLSIRDHDGEPFHPGLYLEVVAFEHMPDLPREVVTETVLPTVELAGRRIQMGKVVVGTPHRPETDNTEEGNGGA